MTSQTFSKNISKTIQLLGLTKICRHSALFKFYNYPFKFALELRKKSCIWIRLKGVYKFWTVPVKTGHRKPAWFVWFPLCLSFPFSSSCFCVRFNFKFLTVYSPFVFNIPDFGTKIDYFSPNFGLRLFRIARHNSGCGWFCASSFQFVWLFVSNQTIRIISLGEPLYELGADRTTPYSWILSIAFNISSRNAFGCIVFLKLNKTF